MSPLILWSVVAMILLGIIVWSEFCVPTRGDKDLPAKIVGLVVLLGLVAWGWGYSELRWSILAALMTIGIWRRLRRGTRSDQFRKVLLCITGPFLLLGFLLAASGTFLSVGLGGGARVTNHAISPDGRWEAQLIEHPGFAYCVDEIVLAPRGLATFDPTAYPTRSLGETTMEGELDHFFWPDPTTLVLFLRPQTKLPPDLTQSPSIRVKVVNLKPPPSESGARASPEKERDLSVPERR